MQCSLLNTERTGVNFHSVFREQSESNRRMQDHTGKRCIIAWAMYDWANSAFATTVMAGFFPVFFKEYWSAEAEISVTTFKLGAANSLASILVALSAPFLGAMADRGGIRKRFLLTFAFLGIVVTGALYFVARGEWQWAATLYVLGIIGFSGSNIFYDSLLVDVAGEDKWDLVSALGFSLGYLGGGLLFALNVLMTLRPDFFGFADTGDAVRTSFFSVAIWWAVFSIPLMLFVKEHRSVNGPGNRHIVRDGVKQVLTTIGHVRRLRIVFLFLLGYWLYIDGVDTIIRMAVDYGMSLGFDSRSLILALLITQFVGFPSAIMFGKLGEKIGAKKGVLLALAVYLGVTIYGFFMDREAEFYILAGVIGLVQGGVQSLSRSLYARIIPKNLSAEFFGFYNLLGKSAAVVGPLLMGTISMKTGNPRLSILSIGVLFVSGALILMAVNEKEGRLAAVVLENDPLFPPPMKG